MLAELQIPQQHNTSQTHRSRQTVASLFTSALPKPSSAVITACVCRAGLLLPGFGGLLLTAGLQAQCGKVASTAVPGETPVQLGSAAGCC